MAARVEQTLADLRGRLLTYTDQAAYWTDEQARLALNETLCLWNLLTGIWHQDETVVTTRLNWDYVTSASILATTRVVVAGHPLAKASYPQLQNGRPRWRNEHTASGGAVPTRPTMWAPIGLQQFVIWPADAVGGQALLIDGVAATPILEDDADTVDLAEDELDVLLTFAHHVLSFSSPGNFAQTQDALAALLKAAAETADGLKTTELYRRLVAIDDARLERLRRGIPTALDAAAGREL